MSGAEPPERVFALRGAIQTARNDRESILDSTDELLRAAPPVWRSNT